MKGSRAGELDGITNEYTKKSFFVFDDHLLKLVLLEEEKRRKGNKNIITISGKVTNQKVPRNGGVSELLRKVDQSKRIC